MFVVRRDPQNPLLTPTSERPWEARAAFNPSIAATGDGGARMYYRALPEPTAVVAPFESCSTIGMAVSKDGVSFNSPRQVLTPRESWEAFGCEDPRATVLDGKTYLTYTALGGFPFGAENIKAAIAISEDGENFEERHLVTPFNAKAFALFPQKIGDEYAAVLTAHTDFTQEYPRPVMALARAKRIEDFWNPTYWEEWHAHLSDHALPNLRRSDEDHVEVGASPIYTEDGWVLIYSYIQHYYNEQRRTFGIEAVLLDLDDPRKIIGRTYPFLVPEESYERFGMIPEIVFPSSADVRGETLDIYYGGADTVCARASVRLQDLLDALKGRFTVTRAEENPILSPIPEHTFESRLVFNPAAIDLGGSVHILYRAMGADNTSEIGYARTEDGIHIDERLPVPVYGPRADFELKLGSPTGNSGCEDARAVVIGDRIYMTYTAYDGVNFPRGALATITTDAFLAKQFDQWSEPVLMTPDGVDDKDVAFLPAILDGHYTLYHRVNGRICADRVADVEFKERAGRCVDILGPRPGLWDGAKVGIAGPPIPVEGGWLMLYHGVSEHTHYRIGAALLDPTGLIVKARTSDPIFEPVEKYEQIGEVPNVVFPCGAIVRDDTLYLYYGGADTVVGVATVSLSRILAALS